MLFDMLYVVWDDMYFLLANLHTFGLEIDFSQEAVVFSKSVV